MPTNAFLMDLASSSIELFRPIELFGNGARMSYEHPILNVDAAHRRQPPISRNSKQLAAIDHFSTRFRHGRNTKLHTPGQGNAIPGVARPAVILLPNPQPREVVASPDVTKSQV